MAGNIFGQQFRIITFGESHGPGIGVVIEGCPAGLEIDLDLITRDLNRRRPGQSGIVSQRNEQDSFEVLAGLNGSITTGAPVTFFIRNKDQNSSDYTHLARAFRPSHADYTYHVKFGVRDHLGGGRSSARETAARVIGGAMAKQLLTPLGVSVNAFVSQVGTIKCDKEFSLNEILAAESNAVRCPDIEVAGSMINLIEQIREEGDTLGGVVTCVINGTPAGWGEPVFDRLEADLAKAMLSINAVKGFEIGSGFTGASMRGSEHNDQFFAENQLVKTKTNYSGGIQGGISNGEEIWFRVAFKPVSTIMQPQQTIDDKGESLTIEGKGRHDPCVVPRAVPVVEAMAAVVLADHYLRNRSSKI
jgi:chorismate synthase